MRADTPFAILYYRYCRVPNEIFKIKKVSPNDERKNADDSGDPFSSLTLLHCDCAGGEIVADAVVHFRPCRLRCVWDIVCGMRQLLPCILSAVACA